MAEFNADLWRAAREPWTLTIDGTTWSAKPVSAEAVITAQMEMQGAAVRNVRRVMRRLFRLAFPRSVLMWIGKAPDPVLLIDAMPLDEWEATVSSFFGWATGKTAPAPRRAPSPPSSSSVPSPTPAGPDSAPTP